MAARSVAALCAVASAAHAFHPSFQLLNRLDEDVTTSWHPAGMPGLRLRLTRMDGASFAGCTGLQVGAANFSTVLSVTNANTNASVTLDATTFDGLSASFVDPGFAFVDFALNISSSITPARYSFAVANNSISCAGVAASDSVSEHVLRIGFPLTISIVKGSGANATNSEPYQGTFKAVTEDPKNRIALTEAHPMNAQTARVRVTATALRDYSAINATIPYTAVFDWPAQLGAATTAAFSSNEIDYDFSVSSTPSAVYEILVPGGKLCSTAACVLYNAPTAVRLVVGSPAQLYNEKDVLITTRPATVSTATFVTNSRNINFRQLGENGTTPLGAVKRFNQLYVALHPNGNSGLNIFSALGNAAGNASSKSFGVVAPGRTFALGIDGLGEGRYLLVRNRSLALPDKYNVAQTVFQDVEIIVDRTPPVGVARTSSSRVYVGDTSVSVVLPTSLFSDTISPSSSIMVVDVMPVGDSQGFTSVAAIARPLGEARLTAPRVGGSAGTASFLVTAHDEAGNKATAVFSIAIYQRPAVSVTVADKRGVFSATTLRTGGSASLATNGNLEFNVVVSLADPASNVPTNGLPNNGLVVTGLAGATISTPVASAGNRVFTYTVSIAPGSVSDSATATIRFEVGAATRDVDGAASGASNTVTLTIDKTAPTGAVRDAVGTARVGIPYYYALPPGGAAALFSDVVSTSGAINIVSAVAAQTIGLSVVLGRQGVAYISGTPTMLPSSSVQTFCNSNASVTQIVFTVTGRDEAGNDATGTLCVLVAAAPASAATLTIARSALTVAETATTGSTGTSVALDASATFTYTGSARSVAVMVDTPDLSSDPAAPADELLQSTYAGTGTLTPYVQDATSRMGTLLLDAGANSLTAADVTTFVQSVTYRLQRARLTPGNRVVRVAVRDTNGFLALGTRIITVTAFNNLPTISGSANSTYTEATSSETDGTPVAAAVVVADDDDTQITAATVGIAIVGDSSTFAACDNQRDVLSLPSSYATPSKVFGVWDAGSCVLALQPVSGMPVSVADMQAALRAVVFKSKNARDPTNRQYVPPAPAYANIRSISVSVTDAAAGGFFSAPASSLMSYTLLTINPVDDAPTFRLGAMYAERGLFFEQDRFANIKQITVDSATYNVRKFVAKVDALSTIAVEIPIKFNLAKVSNGVFAGGQIIDVDSVDPPLAASSITFACLTASGTTGACPSGIAISASLAATNASYNNATGLSTFVISISDPSTVTLGEFGIRFTYGAVTPAPTADFYVDVRNRSCISQASLAPLTMYPDNDRCTFAPIPIAVPSVTPVAVAVGTFTSSKDTISARVQALREADTPVERQIEALQAERQAARGGFAVTFAVNSFSTVNTLEFSAEPPATTSTDLLPAAPGSEVVDAAAAVKLKPACSVFSKPVQVCVYVGDTDTGFVRSLRIASQVDCFDESKGYTALESAEDVEWDPVSGQLCGYTSHFSLMTPVLVPVVQTPVVDKIFMMGGSCPNDCSHHGYCRQEGKCVCFSGFSGYDCSDRTCPAAESWSTAGGIAHRAEECSGRGKCNTNSGLCECLDGYEGSACERTQCANGCSGHGRCRLLSELPNVQASGYSSWESKRVQVCRCDGGFVGPDCSHRVCPRGDDPETVQLDTNRQVQTVLIDFGTLPSSLAGSIPASVYAADEFALVFRTLDGYNYTSPRIADIFDPDNGGLTKLTAALKSLPGFAVSDVVVTKGAGSNGASSPSTFVSYQITFDGTSMSVALSSAASSRSNTGANTVSGNQNLLECPLSASGSMGCTVAGCRPVFEQLRLLDVSGAAGSGITVSTKAILEQPGVLQTGDAALAGRWGVTVTIIVAADGVGGSLTYAASSQIYERTTGALGDAATLPATPLPPSGLNSAVPILYGLLVDFDSASMNTGTFTFKWRLPTCSVSVTTPADRDYESVECSARGLCSRTTGACSCFPGYAGYNCGQQTIVI